MFHDVPGTKVSMLHCVMTCSKREADRLKQPQTTVSVNECCRERSGDNRAEGMAQRMEKLTF